MKHCWMHETTADMLYTFLCRGESTDVPFLQRISHITSNYIKAGRSIDEIPVGDFFAPSLLDFTHGSYLCIDLDVFLTRQSKNRMIRKFGQQLRINRSKIKEASNTNTDFDDPGSALTSTNDNHVAVEIKCSELEKLFGTTGIAGGFLYTKNRAERRLALRAEAVRLQVNGKQK